MRVLKFLVLGSAKFLRGGAQYPGYLEWGCQISWDAKYPVTPGVTVGGARPSRLCRRHCVSVRPVARTVFVCPAVLSPSLEGLRVRLL